MPVVHRQTQRSLRIWLALLFHTTVVFHRRGNEFGTCLIDVSLFHFALAIFTVYRLVFISYIDSFNVVEIILRENGTLFLRFNLLSELPQEQREKLLRDSVLSIEREKWEEMSALPPDQREKFLIEKFSDLPIEHREKWLQIASMTTEERDKIFRENFGVISTEQKQKMIREQYSALRTEDRERLFKENFPELPVEQRQKFEFALLSDWKGKEDEKWEKQEDEEIFNMDNIDNVEADEEKPSVSAPKTFNAVASNERIRKISVVNNDFRPINDDPQSSCKEKSSDESNLGLMSKKNSKDETPVEENKGGNVSKRKRKRKSIMKKKSAQRKASNGSSSQTEMSENDALVAPEESQSEPVRDFYL